MQPNRDDTIWLVGEIKEVLGLVVVAFVIWRGGDRLIPAGHVLAHSPSPRAATPHECCSVQGFTATSSKTAAEEALRPDAQLNHSTPIVEPVLKRAIGHAANADTRPRTPQRPSVETARRQALLVPASNMNPRGQTAERTIARVASASRREVKPFQEPLARTQSVLLGAGIHRFWEGKIGLAIEHFRDAHECNPSDAAPLYFLALSHRRLSEATLAERALTAAVSVECRQPIPNYGQLMERVQGPDRSWIEQARWPNGSAEVISKSSDTLY